ncbi:Tigger transposable element-derived protein 6, partial [Dictyocoela muelleri]
TCKKISNNFLTQIFDKKLFEWFALKRKKFSTIQDVNIKEIALKLASLAGLENFKASNGFIHRFKSRHNITCKLIKGESGLVDGNLIESFKEIYENKMKMYNKNNIFNCDETGFFFKCTPNRTLCLKSETQISGKFSKERVTILFCVSLTGEKIDPLLIGKFKCPRGFKDLDFEKLGIKYEHNSKTLITLEIFERWLYNLNFKMKALGRKILLTLDNAPVHPVFTDYSNIELLFFPPGLTSKIQPLDQGIINAFKCLYKRKLNSKINNDLDMTLSETFTSSLKRFKIIDSLKLILESWSEISSDTITKCYKKAIEMPTLKLNLPILFPS